MRYALAIIRYSKPLDEVLTHLEPHRAYLRELKQQGILLASGPFDPRTGGALLLRLNDAEPASTTLARIRDADPFVTLGVAEYELLVWEPVIGRESLDNLQ